MNQLEIEYKTLLSKEEFQRIEEHLEKVSPVKQTNYYFDTAGFDLKAKRMSLRIRTLAERAELTLKVPQKVGNLEYNHNLSLAEAKTIIANQELPDCQISHLLATKGIDLGQIKVLGHLTTIRREVATKIGLMALDHNFYAGQEDFELELEVQDARQGKVDFDNFLKTNHINFKYAKSKVARFASTLKK